LSLRILQEGLILKQLQGTKGVVQFVDALEDDDHFYLITKLEGGGDLFDFLSDSDCAVGEKWVLDTFFSICTAVAQLHDQDICHLDISLENILFSDSGELKLADFGQSRWNDHVKRIRSSSTARIGKPKYMAPEIVEGLDFDGFQADVYSLGVVLFCLLYGSHPYSYPIDEEDGYLLISNGLFEQFLQATGLEGSKSQKTEDLLDMMLTPAESRSSLQAIVAQMKQMFI
jgi:serine/threonine protein kinase